MDGKYFLQFKEKWISTRFLPSTCIMTTCHEKKNHSYKKTTTNNNKQIKHTYVFTPDTSRQSKTFWTMDVRESKIFETAFLIADNFTIENSVSSCVWFDYLRLRMLTLFIHQPFRRPFIRYDLNSYVGFSLLFEWVHFHLEQFFDRWNWFKRSE